MPPQANRATRVPFKYTSVPSPWKARSFLQHSSALWPYIQREYTQNHQQKFGSETNLMSTPLADRKSGLTKLRIGMMSFQPGMYRCGRQRYQFMYLGNCNSHSPPEASVDNFGGLSCASVLTQVHERFTDFPFYVESVWLRLSW